MSKKFRIYYKGGPDAIAGWYKATYRTQREANRIAQKLVNNGAKWAVVHEVKEAIVARQRFDTPDSVTSSMSFEVTGDPAAVDEFLAMVRNVLHTNAPAYGLECGITKIEGGKV